MKITDQISSEFLANYNLLTFEQVDSTNEAAKRLVKSGAAGNFLIISSEQSKGHGKRGSEWQSLKNNLHLSILLETEKKLEELQELVFLVAVVAANYIESKLSKKCHVQLKWPNDIMIDSMKVGGILLETIKVSGKQFLIIGIGINLMNKPNLKDRQTTSLAEAGGYSASKEEFMAEFIGQFDQVYKRWCNNNNFAEIRQQWLDRAFNLYKAITIDNGERRISGVFREIDDCGAIIVEIASGERITLEYGELLSDV